MQSGSPVYTTSPFTHEFKPKKSMVERYMPVVPPSEREKLQEGYE